MRIHPNGYIIGGAHERGLRHAEAARSAGLGYWKHQISLGNIVVTKKNGKIRYRIKRAPRIDWGSPDELALLRAQDFLSANANKWIVSTTFDRKFRALYDNMVNAYKVG